MNRRDLLATVACAGAILATIRPERLWAASRQLRYHPGRPLGPFSTHQADTVARISDLIIPRTDTPGALDAGVPQFIAVIVGEWYRDEERSLFMAGLANVDARSRPGAESFLALSEDAQIELLQKMDDELQALKASRAPAGNFFQRIKGLTLYGYYTSEAGMKEELRYAIIPGRYDGCVTERLDG